MLLLGAVESILFIPQLGLQSAQNLKVACQLSGHLTHVLPFELTDSVLLLSKAFSSRFQLAFEKLSGVLRLLLTHFQVLVDEQIRQFTCDLLGNMRVTDV